MSETTVTIATYIGSMGCPHKKTVDVDPVWITPKYCNICEVLMVATDVKRVGKAYWEKLVRTQKVEKVEL